MVGRGSSVLTVLTVLTVTCAALVLAGCGEQARDSTSAASQLALLTTPSASVAVVTPAAPLPAASRARASRRLASSLRALRRTSGGRFTQSTYVGSTATPLQDLQGTWSYRPVSLDATARAIDSQGRVNEVQVRSVGGVGYLRDDSGSPGGSACWIRVGPATKRALGPVLGPVMNDIPAIDARSMGGLPTGFSMLDTARGTAMMGPGMIEGTVSLPAAVRLLPAGLRTRITRRDPAGRVRATFGIDGGVLHGAAVRGVDLRRALNREMALTPDDAADVAQDDVLVQLTPSPAGARPAMPTAPHSTTTPRQLRFGTCR